MIHCLETICWVEKGMAAYGSHIEFQTQWFTVSLPRANLVSFEGYFLKWNQHSFICFSYLHNKTGTSQHSWSKCYRVNCSGPQLSSLHSESSWLPPTWRNRINHKVLIWVKPDFLVFPFWYFSLVNNLVGEYQKLLELSTLSLSKPFIFKMERKKERKNSPKWFFLSFPNTVTLPTKITKKLKLIKEH